MAQLAPIILFVYNRPQHTLQTLKALSNNVLANQSELYIYCDGPKESATEEDLKRIEEVRSIVKSKDWCKKNQIIEREKNWGLAENIINGVTEIINIHEKIIVLEDDILTSIGFLKYMNDALDLYEKEENIYGITGYSYFPNEQLPNSFLLPIGSSWSWATWKTKWKVFNNDADYLLHEIIENNQIDEFNFGNYPFFDMLKSQCEGKINSWAIRFYASFFINGGLFLHPKLPLAANIGFDNFATHTKNENVFNSFLYQGFLDISKRQTTVDKKSFNFVQSNFKKKFSPSKRIVIREKIKSIFKKNLL